MSFFAPLTMPLPSCARRKPPSQARIIRVAHKVWPRRGPPQCNPHLRSVPQRMDAPQVYRHTTISKKLPTNFLQSPKIVQKISKKFPKRGPKRTGGPCTTTPATSRRFSHTVRLHSAALFALLQYLASMALPASFPPSRHDTRHASCTIHIAPALCLCVRRRGSAGERIVCLTWYTYCGLPPTPARPVSNKHSVRTVGKGSP